MVLISTIAAAQCTPSTVSPSVTICSPQNGSTVTSPVHVVAVTTSSAPVIAMRIYVDNVGVYAGNSGSVDQMVTMGLGTHNLTINAWDSTGAVFKSTVFVTVGTTPSPAPVSVAISPSSATLAPGEQQQFSSTVLNAANTSVTWAVDGVVGGNSSVGSITTGGLYTAPSVTGSHRVTATSNADSSKSDTALITAATSGGGSGGACSPNPTNNTLTICSPAAGATVTSPVTVSAVATSSAPVEKMLVYVDDDLMYQALNTTSISTQLNLPNGPHSLVVQYYNGNWIKQGESITVGQPAGISIAVTPSTASVVTGGIQQFTATVSGTTNSGVTWQVDGVTGGSSTTGTISGGGLYTAPSTVGTHTVRAISAADPTKTATASVTVTSAPPPPPGGCVGTGGEGTITICSPAPNSTVTSPVTVSAAANTNASVQKFLVYADDNLVYEAVNTRTISASIPLAVGTHFLVAQYFNGNWVKQGVTITVSNSAPGYSIAISPTTATLPTGGTQQFTATVSGGPNTGVTWYVDNQTGGNTTAGMISTSGLYTAPSTAGTHTVTAVANGDTTKRASATVTVTSPPGPGNCVVNTANNTLTICTPQPNATVNSPVRVIAVATSSSPVGKFLVYVDNNLVYQALNTSNIDTSITMSPGSHFLVAQYYNGNWVKQGETITVTTQQVNITVSPSFASLRPGGTQNFSAGSTPVNWSVDGVQGGNSIVGTITSNGTYSAGSSRGTHIVTATSTADSTQKGTATVWVTSVATNTQSMLTYHNDLSRQGANTNETELTPVNVNTSQFGKLYSFGVDGAVYAQPIYVSGVGVSGQTRNVLYVATQHNSFYAFDADGLTNAPLWKVNLGTPQSSTDGLGITPEIGITSTPVVDRNTNTIYVVNVSTDGGTKFRLHALDLATGAEKFGGPGQVTATVSGTGQDSINGQITLPGGCYQRSGLALANGNIYIGFGHCSHGWLLAYNATTLAQVGVFNTSPNGSGGTIWMGGGAPAVDANGFVYVMSGANFGSTVDGYSNSFLKFSPVLSLIDYFQPSDNATLIANDTDLGAGAPVLMPDGSSSTYPRQLIGAGKDGRIFNLSRDNMGQFHSTDQVIQSVFAGTTQNNNFYDTSAYWNGNVYIHGENGVLRQYSWTNGMLSSNPVATGGALFGKHGATPVVSASGTINGIVWELQHDQAPTGGPAILRAYDATNVGNEIYNSTLAGSRDQAGKAVKFTVPTVVNGRVYVGTANQVNVYGLF